MISIVVAGLSSYFRLGRSEDPAFTFRTMVVQAAWPGQRSTIPLTQVTERLERKLQETKGLDFLRSYTSPGLTTIFVNLKGSTSARECRTSGIKCVRTSAICAEPCPRAWSAPASTMISATPMALFMRFTADGFSHRELRDYVEDMRSKLVAG